MEPTGRYSGPVGRCEIRKCFLTIPKPAAESGARSCGSPSRGWAVEIPNSVEWSLRVVPPRLAVFVNVNCFWMMEYFVLLFLQTTRTSTTRRRHLLASGSPFLHPNIMWAPLQELNHGVWGRKCQQSHYTAPYGIPTMRHECREA